MFLLCFIVYNRMKNLIEISKTIDEFLHIFFMIFFMFYLMYVKKNHIIYFNDCIYNDLFYVFIKINFD